MEKYNYDPVEGKVPENIIIQVGRIDEDTINTMVNGDAGEIANAYISSLIDFMKVLEDPVMAKALVNDVARLAINGFEEYLEENENENETGTGDE